MDDDPLAGLVDRARRGDQDAWDALVARYQDLVWAVARSHRLNQADAADVFQTTWLRLVEHLDGIRDERSLGSWLATTTRRECWRLQRRGRREPPTEIDADRTASDEPQLDERVVRAEEHGEVWEALQRLSERCQRLLRVLMADPAPSYEEVSAALDMPIGSIGPTRGRCLTRLRDVLASSGRYQA